MANRDFWKSLARGADILQVFSFQPIMIGLSSLFGVLSQHIPSISAYGIFGIGAVGLCAYLALSISLFFQAKAKKKSRVINNLEAHAFVRILGWWGWKWFIGIALIMVSVHFLDFRPPLPAGINAAELRYPIASYREMRQETIVGRTIVLYAMGQSFPDHPMRISKKRFIRCDVFGPAVAGLLGNDVFLLNDFGVYGSTESILLNANGNVSVGMVGLDQCQFVQCSFRYISFAGITSELDKIRKIGAWPKNVK